MIKVIVSSALFSAFLFVMISTSFAQTTGTILGRVKDTTGGVLPGVGVTLTNTATGEKREVVSDHQGNYAAPLLPPSSYRLEFKRPGFKTVLRAGVTLRVLDTLVVDVSMEVGPITETVAVSGEAPFRHEPGTI